VSMLQKKLTYQTTAAKQNLWVESVFLKMNESQMKKLKTRYEKKLGVKFSV
jgi:hypothetical protein